MVAFFLSVISSCDSLLIDSLSRAEKHLWPLDCEVVLGNSSSESEEED